MPTAVAHDGSELLYEVHGERGPTVLVFSTPRPPRGPLGIPTRKLNRALIDGLSGDYRLVLLDYPGEPKPHTLTPSNVTTDLLSIADAAGADRFTWWGYSWSSVIGLQLAVAADDRVAALVCGGFPPLGGPYEEMLALSRSVVDGSAKLPVVKLSLPKRMREKMTQFVTYYEGLQDFDDREAQSLLQMPRLSYVGSEDHTNVGGERIVSISERTIAAKDELERFGWDVVVVDGFNHRTAMGPEVFMSVVKPWLDSRVLARSG